MSYEDLFPDPIPKEWYDNKYWEQKIREEILGEEQGGVDWFNVASFYILSEDFIREFEEEFKDHWTALSTDQNLTEKFIEEFADKVEWVAISAHQHLSVPFVIKWRNEVNWNNIFRYQEYDDETREMLSKLCHVKLVPREKRIRRFNDQIDE